MNVNISIFNFVFLYLMSISYMNAQIQWNTNLGGGVSSSTVLFGATPKINYAYGPLFQAGSSISSSFGKETLAGWEVGLNVVHEKLKWSLDSSGDRDGTINDWYIQMPISLILDLFEKVGFKLGGSISKRITNVDIYRTEIRTWMPAAHLGVYVHITPRIRLDLTPYLNILTREKNFQDYQYKIDNTRGLGGTLNLRYTINQ